MGGGPVLACLAAVVLAVTGSDHWSRPATPERRQGDWVPLSCATPNCRPLDQGVQATDSLPSVLTPPPRLEEARLLPPPPPPDGLFQTAASGFLQAFTQQQPPRKPLQFLQETTAQSNNRPQAQFLKSQGPVGKPQQFLQEPSADFTPPQESRQQLPLVPYNQQQFLPDQPYLNQPLFIGPQFLAAPFFPQSGIPPQNIQPISPVQLQTQTPIVPDVPKQIFQAPADRPLFLQQVTSGPQEPQSASQRLPQELTSQQQYSVNNTSSQAHEEANEEVQLLYVPVETLNRARNLGRPKSIPQGSSQQSVAATETNTFESASHNFEFSTVRPSFEEHHKLNTQAQESQFKYNVKQNDQFEQKPPPEDQEKFNTQTYTVAQQFNVKPQNDQFEQTPLENAEGPKTQTTKQQYNFKLNDQYQPQFQHDQANFQQVGQFQRLPEFQNQQTFGTLDQNLRQQTFGVQNQPQQDQTQFNAQTVNQQFTTQQSAEGLQQVVPVQQQRFQQQSIPVEQQRYQQQSIPAEQQRFQQQQTHMEQQRFQQQQLPVEQQRFQQQQTPVEQQRFQQQQLPVEQQRFQQQQTPVEKQRFQQQQTPVEQQRFQSIPDTQRFNAHGQIGQEELTNFQTAQLQQQQQLNQQTFDAASTIKDQPYVNEPIQYDQHTPSKEQDQTQQFSTQQTQPQQQFELPEVNHQTAAPITQTKLPDAYTTQKIKKQRFRNSQDSIRNVQQQNTQFTKKFPEDYRETVKIDPIEQAQNFRQQQKQSWTQQNQNQNIFNQQEIPDIKHANTFQSDRQRGTTIPPPPSTQSPPPQTTLAPNQPPLSVYMETTEDTKVNDVLRLLKNAKTIQVLDTVGPESPQVFVGPSNLKAPTGYIKFELPYLNAIENNNRVERKVDKLPFFVAPLNFNPPPGYSKIPFPAPHIGSVVVSNVTVLKTALHEKPYEVAISTTERFKDQYTLPAEISPISPQLPSLINSLQDEIYSGSSTTNLPSTTQEATTVYTTPAYRGRGTSRGSYRGSATSASPSRRPQSRTRRPYDGQPYSRRRTTTTTTAEPSTEAPIQQFTSPPEQLATNTDSYNIQTAAAPVQAQPVNNQHLQQENAAAYYNQQFLENSYNQFASQQQQLSAQPVDHHSQVSGVESAEDFKQHHRIEDSTQNFGRDSIAQTTVGPALTRPEVNQEEQTFTSQRTGGTRRDPTRQHQRFRGRQRLTTTTTEQYDSPVQQEYQFNQQADPRLNYQNPPRRNHLENHRLVENTHFTASLPNNKLNIQTERADVAFQTTERQFIAQNEDNFNSQNLNKDSHHDSQLHVGQQFNTEPLPQVSESNTQRELPQQYISEKPHEQSILNLGQVNINQQTQNQFNYVPQVQQSTPSSVNQFQQGSTQSELYDQNTNTQSQAHFHQVNADHIDQLRNVQTQQNYFDQQTQQKQGVSPITEEEQVHSQNPYNDQQLFQLAQEQARDSSLSNQEQHIPKSDQVSEIPQSAPQQRPIQTPQPEALPQAEVEPQVPQYNQQRLVKYNNKNQNRAQVDTPSTIEEQISHQQGRGQHHFQSNPQTTEVSTTDDATTKASLVRVRGRVRGRQRASSRNHQSTTEEPNYPTTYLTRQRITPKTENSQEYASRKKVNYNRESTINANQEDQNIPDSSYTKTEQQPTSDRILESSDVSATTTEAPNANKGRRYQHILNRNKIRRTRPTNTPSTAGSSGTTRFLTPTTPPPLTRLPVTRGRIRKPVSTTTTTEYPQVSPSWNERDNFAPSAGSNEILEPLYQTKDKTNEHQSFGFLRPPVIPPKSVPKEQPPPENQDDYWNQGVTIQQSTSFDFKADPAAVTPPSFGTNEQNQGISSIWNGQVELQDGQFYDVFNQQQASKHANDQTPFSSDQQKVVYKEVKNRQLIGKENQYTEKTYEITRPSVVEDEESDREKVYPVYREIIKPAESIQDEAQSQVAEDKYQVDGKGYEKDVDESSEQSNKGYSQPDVLVPEDGSEIKEGALKRKISATNAGKKGLKRRGQWVRVRVRKPQDSLETAESQNLAVHSENAIQVVTTKVVGEKAPWNPEPSPTTTELPQMTTEQPTASEPAETINFEEALKDMLKEFITNPDENKEEEEEEASTTLSSDTANTTVIKEEVKLEDESYRLSDESEKKSTDEKVKIEQREEEQNQEYVTKTLIPEAMTETFNEEGTTIFQAIDNVETTIEPEVTTNLNAQVYNSQNSRVLGTSTTTEISLETEICYRGRCVKTKKLDGDSDLLTME